MRRKLVDRVITTLSWVPSERAGIPFAVILVLLPVVYLTYTESRLSPSAQHVVEDRADLVRDDDDEEEAVVIPDDKDDPARIRFARMAEDLQYAAQQYVARTSAQVAIHIKDLSGGYEWSYHADDLFPSASLIKVPIMIGVMEKINNGELSLNSRLKLSRRNRMGGSGRIKWKRDGTRFTVRALLDKLIHNSDNTAMRILLNEVGVGYMQNQFPRMGLVYTELYPEGLSLQSGRVRYENYTTAREMTFLMEKVYRGQMVTRFASELMLEILKGRYPRRYRLAKKLPAGWSIAHKTGLLRRACHDSGVIFSPQGDYAVTVLTGRNRGYGEAKEFISQLGVITFKYYQSDLGLYAKAPGESSGTAAP
ncbi:MAG: serine hydrolase [Elusimicrobiota bacterium]